jgi:ABC-type phosphate transport system substrate-binding protein
MHAFRRARRLSWPAALALLALCLALCAPPVPSASAIGGRTAKVAPAKNLGDQVAFVTWQGFRPTQLDGTYGVTILQCRLEPKSVIKDCNTAETFPLSLTGNQAGGVTQANGTGEAFIDVESTARLPALKCSHTTPCSLLLYENTPAGFDPAHLPPDRASVRLEFRENSADCPPPTTFDVRLESEASASAAFYQWAADLCRETKPFALDVTNTSSNASRQQFFLGHVDVGVSSLPPKPGEVTDKTPKYAVAPVDMTALVVAFNIVDPVTGHQITDLTLTPRLVARLVSDSDVLGFFSDPEFLKLNPHHTFPAAAADPGVRAEQNADTWIVSHWLNGDHAARAFLDGKDPYGIPVNNAWQGVKYPTDIFEARNPNGVYLPRTGEEDIALRLFHSTKPADGVPTNPADVGFFSILDLPTASRFALPVAKLTTGVGKPVVVASAASIDAGYKSMTTTTDGFRVAAAVPGDPQAWPLTKVDHALVPTTTNSGDPTKLEKIQRLLRFVVGPGQLTLPHGFVPLPRALADRTTWIASALFAPTITTTTTTTTAPAPFDPNAGSFQPSPSTPVGPASPAPTIAPKPRPTVPSAPLTPASSAPVTTPEFVLASAGSERLALPVILPLGLLAFGFSLSGVARRGATSVVAWTRRRRRGRRVKP